VRNIKEIGSVNQPALSSSPIWGGRRTPLRTPAPFRLTAIAQVLAEMANLWGIWLS
jgi:hypothetical protein